MVFKCQEDSFLKEYTSDVISCVPAKFDTLIDGKKLKIDGYEIICKDTILFPEGGGQPFDQGYLNDKRVFQVLRKGDQALHYLKEPLNPGDVVKQSIDWNRRFDHMQQHSGQHLISALLEQECNIQTLSWWLGEDESYVELNCPSVSKEQMDKIEQIANDYIRQFVKVTVKVYNKDTPEEELKRAGSARGLPEDHIGDIRVINIEGIDSNMCCGTHVSNLSELQVVKFLHSEKSKRKNQCLVYFLIGGRVLRRLGSCLKREQKITALLNNGPFQHVDLIDKLVKTSKQNNKNIQVLLKEMAIYEAAKLKNTQPKPLYYCLHRKEAEPDFMNAVIREVGSTDVFLFLSTGDDKGPANIVLYGKENIISELGNKICEMLLGKGAGKGTKFQAKVPNLRNKAKVEELLNDYFK